MCRNIRTLFNFEPPATEEEIRASALQFVRKLSGFAHPSKANEQKETTSVNLPRSVVRFTRNQAVGSRYAHSQSPKTNARPQLSSLV